MGLKLSLDDGNEDAIAEFLMASTYETHCTWSNVDKTNFGRYTVGPNPSKEYSSMVGKAR